ncbi:hypothetical protein GCM10011391_11270 [Pullulanibacillus camelliae]|uniref:Uncharacterized protein n=1 Tax=Pullulanibacillus camelliae TaxID=1707096 RepID=A0A8J2VNA1_9BACL|nr:hypothetical protein GCM10011391_11270 [Pullulanibacillus camelliae]
MERKAREIRNTLKSCVPESPLTHDATLESCGKQEIGKTPQRSLTTPQQKASALDRKRSPSG